MKYIIFSFFIFLSVFSKAQITKAELTVTGLTCSMCSKATYKQLVTIKEVLKVETDLNKASFLIIFKEGSSINPENIRKKVNNAGFSIGELLLEINFKNQEIENNKIFTLNNISYSFMETKSNILNGVTKIKILDKGFIVDKEYKKQVALIKQYPTYNKTVKNYFHIKVI